MQYKMLMAACWLCCAPLAGAQQDAHELSVDVQQRGNTFVTHASFKLPLKPCQAWGFITDYDAAVRYPGVVSSRTTRLGVNKARVDRVMQDTLLFFPIRMHTVLEITEVQDKEVDFVQVEGDAKSYRGSWRLEDTRDGIYFRYDSESEPDSSLPTAVIRYFLNQRLRSNFAAMAQYGAARQDTACVR